MKHSSFIENFLLIIALNAFAKPKKFRFVFPTLNVFYYCFREKTLCKCRHFLVLDFKLFFAEQIVSVAVTQYLRQPKFGTVGLTKNGWYLVMCVVDQLFSAKFKMTVCLEESFNYNFGSLRIIIWWKNPIFNCYQLHFFVPFFFKLVKEHFKQYVKVYKPGKQSK